MEISQVEGIWAFVIGGVVFLFGIVFSIVWKLGKPNDDNKKKPPLEKNGGEEKKTPTPTPSAKGLGGFGWTVIILLIIGMVTIVVTNWPRARDAEANASAGQNRKANTNIQPREEWVFEWEIPQGNYVRGKNKSGPITAEVDFRPDGGLWVDLLYTEYGRAEKAKLRLAKISDKSWEGPWGQANPQDEGRCDLHEVTPGNLAGTIKGTAGISAFCTLKRK
jgi:hypothetical protein